MSDMKSSTQIWFGRLVQRCPHADRALAAAPPANRKPFLAIKPIDLLQVHATPLAFGHLPQPPVAEPASFSRQHA
jgi:hypothetical protein